MLLSILVDAFIDVMPLRALEPIRRSKLLHVLLPAAPMLSSEMLPLECVANHTTRTIAIAAAINRLPTTKQQTTIETLPDTTQLQIPSTSCYTQLQPLKCCTTVRCSTFHLACQKLDGAAISRVVQSKCETAIEIFPKASYTKLQGLRSYHQL